MPFPSLIPAFFLPLVPITEFISLYLGGEKDFDDPRHIYRVLDRMLDQDKFKYYLKEMHIKNSVIKDALGDDLEA